MKMLFPLYWSRCRRFLDWLPLALAAGSLALFGLTAGLRMAPDASWPWRSKEGLPAGISAPAGAPARGDGESRLLRQMAAMAPRGIYVVIDTGQNLLYIKKGDDILHRAVVSTGSGTILQDPESERKWVFDTPRGVFSIKSKTRNPYWVKPDWAFIEKGEPIPASPRDRVEAGGLGAYALGIGDGYFIHGTLYTRLLGRNVTHGCVRVADRDLQYVYETVPAGAKVIIF